MIQKTGNILLLIILLNTLLLGNLTQSRTYQKSDKGEIELHSLALDGKDFLFGISNEEFEIIENSNYSYTEFRSVILIICSLIILMIIIQFIKESSLSLSVLYSLLFIPAFFICMYIAQYPNFYFELSLTKFPQMNIKIDSRTPALMTVQWLAFSGLVFNWCVYLLDKKFLQWLKNHRNIQLKILK